MSTRLDARLTDITESILGSYARHGNLQHIAGGNLPSREVIWSVVEDLLRLLFPGFLESAGTGSAEFAVLTAARVRSIGRRLSAEIEKGLRFRLACEDDCRERAEAATGDLLAGVPAIRDVLATDIAAAYDGDPAAPVLRGDRPRPIPASRPSRSIASPTCSTRLDVPLRPADHDRVRPLADRHRHPSRRHDRPAASSSITAPAW